MQIRTATRSDADAVWHLLQPVFRAGDTYAVDPEISKDSALSYWMDDPAACYVAVDAGQIIGTYYIKTNQQGGGAHVCNCGYVAGVQGKGWQRRCVPRPKPKRALGYSAMQFNFVLTSNADAIRLWHKLGFDTVGTLPNAFDHPALGMVDAQVMYKWLAD